MRFADCDAGWLLASAPAGVSGALCDLGPLFGSERGGAGGSALLPALAAKFGHGRIGVVGGDVVVGLAGGEVHDQTGELIGVAGAGGFLAHDLKIPDPVGDG